MVTRVDYFTIHVSFLDRLVFRMLPFQRFPVLIIMTFNRRRLRRRLGRSYGSYLKTIETLVDTMRKLGEKLGIDDAGAVGSSAYINEAKLKQSRRNGVNSPL